MNASVNLINLGFYRSKYKMLQITGNKLIVFVSQSGLRSCKQKVYESKIICGVIIEPWIIVKNVIIGLIVTVAI